MNNYNKKDNDTKKIYTMIVLIATLMVCVTGATYAYYAVSATNTGITGTAATVGLTLAVTREAPTTAKWNASTKVMVPQLDGGLGTAMNSTNLCVDGNGNVVCQVLKIVITNTSTAKVKLKGTLHFTGGTFNNLFWRQTTNANTVGTNTIYKAATAATVSSTTADTANALLINDLSLNATNGSATYYVVVWIRETNASQNTTDTGTWTANVNFIDAANGEGVTSTITA